MSRLKLLEKLKMSDSDEDSSDDPPTPRGGGGNDDDDDDVPTTTAKKDNVPAAQEPSPVPPPTAALDEKHQRADASVDRGQSEEVHIPTAKNPVAPAPKKYMKKLKVRPPSTSLVGGGDDDHGEGQQPPPPPSQDGPLASSSKRRSSRSNSQDVQQQQQCQKSEDVTDTPTPVPTKKEVSNPSSTRRSDAADPTNEPTEEHEVNNRVEHHEPADAASPPRDDDDNSQQQHSVGGDGNRMPSSEPYETTSFAIPTQQHHSTNNHDDDDEVFEIEDDCQDEGEIYEEDVLGGNTSYADVTNSSNEDEPPPFEPPGAGEGRCQLGDSVVGTAAMLGIGRRGTSRQQRRDAHQRQQVQKYGDSYQLQNSMNDRSPSRDNSPPQYHHHQQYSGGRSLALVKTIHNPNANVSKWRERMNVQLAEQIAREEREVIAQWRDLTFKPSINKTSDYGIVTDRPFHERLSKAPKKRSVMLPEDKESTFKPIICSKSKDLAGHRSVSIADRTMKAQKIAMENEKNREIKKKEAAKREQDYKSRKLNSADYDRITRLTSDRSKAKTYKDPNTTFKPKISPYACNLRKPTEVSKKDFDALTQQQPPELLHIRRMSLSNPALGSGTPPRTPRYDSNLGGSITNNTNTEESYPPQEDHPLQERGQIKRRYSLDRPAYAPVRSNGSGGGGYPQQQRRASLQSATMEPPSLPPPVPHTVAPLTPSSSSSSSTSSSTSTTTTTTTSSEEEESVSASTASSPARGRRPTSAQQHHRNVLQSTLVVQ